jgi:hypothetical protein
MLQGVLVSLLHQVSHDVNWQMSAPDLTPALLVALSERPTQQVRNRWHAATSLVRHHLQDIFAC